MGSRTRQASRDTNPGTVRASISFPQDDYRLIAQLAKENRVSVAWVIRDAVDSYLKQKWPLLQPEVRDK